MIGIRKRETIDAMTELDGIVEKASRAGLLAIIRRSQDKAFKVGRGDSLTETESVELGSDLRELGWKFDDFKTMCGVAQYFHRQQSFLDSYDEVSAAAVAEGNAAATNLKEAESNLHSARQRHHESQTRLRTLSDTKVQIERRRAASVRLFSRDAELLTDSKKLAAFESRNTFDRIKLDFAAKVDERLLRE